jgi:voltage-gated sodium channel
MIDRCRRLVAAAGFHRAVLALILVNAAVMGLETWPALAARWGSGFALVNAAVQALFVAEIAARIVACGRRPLDFFRDGWNAFDFAVVALSLLPVAGPFATVARLARVLRVARMVSGIPELRLIIGTMLRSIPSMGHVLVLLALLVFVYGVVGHHLFAGVDPERWGDLGRAGRTLFEVMTLEGWVEILNQAARATPWAWCYFASFIVVAVFVVVNLFIAVVINNLEKVRSEEGQPPGNAGGPARDAAELRALAARVDELSTALRALADRAR